MNCNVCAYVTSRYVNFILNVLKITDGNRSPIEKIKKNESIIQLEVYIFSFVKDQNLAENLA